MKLKDLSDEELRFGIERCRARLSGTMPKGYMKEGLIKEALREYKSELDKRDVKQILFE